MICTLAVKSHVRPRHKGTARPSLSISELSGVACLSHVHRGMMWEPLERSILVPIYIS